MSKIVLAPTETLTLELAGAVAATQPEYSIAYINATHDTPLTAKGATNNTSPVTAVAADADDYQIIVSINIVNLDSSSVTVIAKITGGTARNGRRRLFTSGDSGDMLQEKAVGEKGDSGTAATIAVGDVTTIPPGAPATVTNSGTPAAAILDFEIPQGAAGESGSSGSNGSNGAPGALWYSGAGAPDGGTGIVGDWYIDTATNDYYEKTGAATWTKRGTFVGGTGSSGPWPCWIGV